MVVLGYGCAERPGKAVEGDAAQVGFAPLSFGAWQEKLASYPPDVVVVDLWATWCVSCLERFPHMVALWQRYRDRGVRFVSLNLDDHEDSEALADARLLLQQFGAGFENYYLDENLMIGFERLGLIGIPAVVLYDRSGKEAIRLTGDNPNRQFTDADVEAALQALLGGQ